MGLKAIVVNNLSDDVSVIDVPTKTVIAIVPVGTTPDSVAITADGSKAYVTNFANNEVFIIDLISNAQFFTNNGSTSPKTINVGSHPTELEVVGNEQVYAINSNFLNPSVSVIDVNSGRVVNVIPVGARPEFIAFRPDRKYAYVVNTAAGSISVIDVAKSEVHTTITLKGESLQAVEFKSDGKKAYVINQEDNEILIIDTVTHTFTPNKNKPIPVGTDPTSLVTTPPGVSPSKAFRPPTNTMAPSLSLKLTMTKSLP